MTKYKEVAERLRSCLADIVLTWPKPIKFPRMISISLEDFGILLEAAELVSGTEPAWCPWEQCGPLTNGRYLIDSTDAEIFTAHWDSGSGLWLDLDRPSSSVVIYVAHVYRPGLGPVPDVPES